VVTADLRGHGDSDCSFSQFGDASTARDLEALVEHRAHAPVVLLSLYGVLFVGGWTAGTLAFAAGCWFFRVGLDRAVGYGPRPFRSAAPADPPTA
jgi:hypothetical protein